MTTITPKDLKLLHPERTEKEEITISAITFKKTLIRALISSERTFDIICGEMDWFYKEYEKQNKETKE